MSVNDTDPALLFGGTWERIEGRFLLGASEGYPAGNTGGSETHTLTVSEMPSHSHGANNGNVQYPYVGSGSAGRLGTSGTHAFDLGSHFSTTSSGGSQPHNNMPPYLSVYMWKRVD